jgi:ABC-2 type transport system ATP-binding protein
MIEIKNLSYRYTRRKSLFNGLNMQLMAGKTYGLLGKNGAGKSSLIKNIAGLLFPTNGSCSVNGYNPCKRETAFLEQFFFIPEECELPRLTIPEFTKIYAPFYPKFQHDQFLRNLAIFNVGKDSHLYSLSFGQKKKAYIAFALAANTDVLIMDEPTNGLDIPSKVQFRNMVAGAGNEKRITIMSTHQVRDLDDLISSVIVVDNGEVLLQANKEEVNERLFFSVGNENPSGEIIYTHQSPQGEVKLSTNPEKLSSYLDLELLFNATLEKKERLQQIFSSNNPNGYAHK